jgi:hypothetical protein
VEPVDKSTWFMVETENVQWWRNFQWQSSSAEDPGLPEGSRVERIKAALSRKKEKSILPLYNDSKSLPSPPATVVPPPDTLPQYPNIIERGYKAPLYQPPQQSVGQVPVPPVTRTLYGSNKSQLRSPPKALITQGLSRSLMRGDRRGLPRSPAGRRKSWLSRAALHHPFLPSDASSVIAQRAVPKISRPSPLQPVSGLSASRSVPIKPASRPPPLDLDEEPRRAIRFGSPQVRMAASPKIRIMSPAF